jgi:hypothetical protein
MVSFWLLCRSKGMRKYNAIDKWNSQLKSIYQTVSNRVGWDGFLRSGALHLWDMLIACFGDLRANAYCFVTLEIECWIWVTRNADVIESLNWTQWSKPIARGEKRFHLVALATFVVLTAFESFTCRNLLGGSCTWTILFQRLISGRELRLEQFSPGMRVDVTDITSPTSEQRPLLTPFLVHYPNHSPMSSFAKKKIANIL